MEDVTAAELNELAEEELVSLLTECCGSSRWVAEMMARRPFESANALRAAAEESWAVLGPIDWLEAFDHHPRIGESNAAVEQRERASTWSKAEQGAVSVAGNDVRAQLARVNRDYELKFGFIYIVCATGKSADELLSIATSRLSNDRDAELGIAAEEQRKIMHLRIEKLLHTPETA